MGMFMLVHLYNQYQTNEGQYYNVYWDCTMGEVAKKFFLICLF